ncbi:hypothetical protein Dimus_024882 [Dionaea muscipula]
MGLKKLSRGGRIGSTAVVESNSSSSPPPPEEDCMLLLLPESIYSPEKFTPEIFRVILLSFGGKKKTVKLYWMEEVGIFFGFFFSSCVGGRVGKGSDHSTDLGESGFIIREWRWR